MLSRIEQICSDKGLKMTDQRRIIAQVLSESIDHPDVDLVYRRATELDPRISIATVYRTLRLFEEANILEKHDFGDGRARYEEASGDHHDHLINIKTGEVVEFYNQEIEAMKQQIDNLQEQLNAQMTKNAEQNVRGYLMNSRERGVNGSLSQEK